MLKLIWSRTVIGGRTAPYDFAASDGDVKVGRIYRHETSQHQHGHWYWSMNAFGPGIHRHGVTCSGMVATKDEAAAMVEQTWQKCRRDQV